MNSERKPIIELEHVQFGYNGQPALEDVCLTVAAGELACIVGPNGGGKTTLLKLILGLLRPTAGTVRVLGQSPRRACRRIGYMPQHMHYDPLFPITVLEIVLMGRLGRRLGGRYDRADRAAARAALDEVNMGDRAGDLFADLSGGQRQRALIARALACEPEILILDEPTANVDARLEAHLLQLLQELNRRMTILMVSHDLGFVSGIVQSVICVNGRVVVHPTSAVTGEVIEEIYGGSLRMIRHDHRCSDHGHAHD